MRTWLRWLVLALILAGVGAFYGFGLQEYFSFDNIRGRVGEIKTRVDDNLIIALIAFFAVYTVMTAFSVPAAWVLTLVAGALFGRFVGTGIALLAATVGATFAFWSSRFLLRDWVQARFGPRLAAFDQGFEKDGAFYLFTLRLAPVVPFFLINLGMGLTPIGTWTYFWVSLVGMLPGSFLYANAGAELEKLQKPSDVLSPGLIVSLIVLGLAPLLFRKAIQWTTAARRSESGK